MIGARALTVYREVINDHRSQLGVDESVLTANVLLEDLTRALDDQSPAFSLCRALTEAGVLVTLQVARRIGQMTATEVCSAIGDRLGWAPRFTVQVGREILCSDILLAGDIGSAHRASQFRRRARWCACLVTEAVSTDLESLDIDILVLDPNLTQLIKPDHRRKVTLLPAWIEDEPLPLDPSLEPDSILILANIDVPDRLCEETAQGIDRISNTYHGVSVFVCGPWPAAMLPRQVKTCRVSSRTSRECMKILENRPICVVLHGPGRPSWVVDLLAKGCPVISIPTEMATSGVDLEFKEGIIQVPGDRRTIAEAVGSLLISGPRMASNLIQAASFVESLAPPTAAAQALIREFRSRCGPDLRLHACSEPQDGEAPLFDVA